MLDRPQQTGYFRLWQGMIASCRQRALGRHSRPVRVRRTMAGALRGVPAVMGGGRRRFIGDWRQGRGFFPFQVSAPGTRRGLV